MKKTDNADWKKVTCVDKLAWKLQVETSSWQLVVLKWIRWAFSLFQWCKTWPSTPSRCTWPNGTMDQIAGLNNLWPWQLLLVTLTDDAFRDRQDVCLQLTSAKNDVCWRQWSSKVIDLEKKMDVVILLMEEILHHLGCINLVNNGMSYLSTGAGFLPSTVALRCNARIHIPQQNPKLHRFQWCMHSLTPPTSLPLIIWPSLTGPRPRRVPKVACLFQKASTFFTIWQSWHGIYQRVEGGWFWCWRWMTQMDWWQYCP